MRAVDRQFSASAAVVAALALSYRLQIRPAWFCYVLALSQSDRLLVRKDLPATIGDLYNV